jgi:hypothetical protein
VPVKSNHKLQKSRSKRRKRSPKAVHINVCSTTDDSSLLLTSDLALSEEYVLPPLRNLIISRCWRWLGFFERLLMSRWILRRRLHRMAMDLKCRWWYTCVWNYRQFIKLQLFSHYFPFTRRLALVSLLRCLNSINRFFCQWLDYRNLLFILFNFILLIGICFMLPWTLRATR